MCSSFGDIESSAEKHFRVIMTVSCLNNFIIIIIIIVIMCILYKCIQVRLLIVAWRNHGWSLRHCFGFSVWEYLCNI